MLYEIYYTKQLSSVKSLKIFFVLLHLKLFGYIQFGLIFKLPKILHYSHVFSEMLKE